jgi:serine acetyltransferase
LLRRDGWKLEPTRVSRRASIRSHATMWGAMIGGRRSVTRDVAPGVAVIGVPARIVER